MTKKQQVIELYKSLDVHQLEIKYYLLRFLINGTIKISLSDSFELEKILEAFIKPRYSYNYLYAIFELE